MRAVDRAAGKVTAGPKVGGSRANVVRTGARAAGDGVAAARAQGLNPCSPASPMQTSSCRGPGASPPSLREAPLPVGEAAMAIHARHVGAAAGAMAPATVVHARVAPARMARRVVNAGPRANAAAHLRKR